MAAKPKIKFARKRRHIPQLEAHANCSGESSSVSKPTTFFPTQKARKSQFERHPERTHSNCIAWPQLTSRQVHGFLAMVQVCRLVEERRETLAWLGAACATSVELGQEGAGLHVEDP